MKIKICHSKYGVCFDGDAAKIEEIEQDDKITFVVTDYDGSERKIVCENEYTVVRIGDKEKSQKKKFFQPKQTTWDLVRDFDRAIQTMKEANVDTEHLHFYLPGPYGWMTHYGPMSAEEAYLKCKEYWESKEKAAQS